MNEREDPLVAIAKVAAALLPAFILLYQENQRFRWMVDQGAAELVYRLRLTSWRRRIWNRMQPHEQERYVELHGSPEC